MDECDLYLTFQYKPHRGYGYVLELFSGDDGNDAFTIVLKQSGKWTDHETLPGINTDYEYEEKRLDLQFLQQIEHQLAMMTFPLIPPNAKIGLGGIGYSLSLKTGQGVEVFLKWWLELPDEWRDLQPVITQLHDISEGNVLDFCKTRKDGRGV